MRSLRTTGSILLLFTLALALLAGCGQTEPDRPAAPPKPAVNAPLPPPPAPVPAAPQTVQQKAEVGVGEKGRGYGLGPVATPAAAYFAAKERIAFDVQIPHAMQIFKAIEGRAPKSHEEFMEQIIKVGQINLPELPPGHRYVYDQKQEQLMVEQPAQKP